MNTVLQSCSTASFINALCIELCTWNNWYVVMNTYLQVFVCVHTATTETLQIFFFMTSHRPAVFLSFTCIRNIKYDTVWLITCRHKSEPAAVTSQWQNFKQGISKKEEIRTRIRLRKISYLNSISWDPYTSKNVNRYFVRTILETAAML